MPAIKSILVAIDFHEEANQVLNYAVDFAAKLGAQLTVLHAYNLPVYNFPDGSFVPTAEVAANVGEAAQKQLDATVQRLKDKGIQVAALLRNGQPAQEINAAAAEISADLIIMGTHGRGVIGRALLGSTANAVVRSAQVPVLTVRYERS